MFRRLICASLQAGVKQVNGFERDDLGLFFSDGSDFINTLNMSRLFSKRTNILPLKWMKSLSGSPVQASERFITNFFSSFLLVATRPLRFLKTLPCPMAVSRVLQSSPGYPLFSASVYCCCLPCAAWSHCFLSQRQGSCQAGGQCGLASSTFPF